MSTAGFVVQDISTGLAWKGRPVGITRFEQEIAKGLFRWDKSRVRFVRYDAKRRVYVWVPEAEASRWLEGIYHNGDVKHAPPKGIVLRERLRRAEVGSKAWKILRRGVYRVGYLFSQPVAEYSERFLCLLLEFARELRQCYRVYQNRVRAPEQLPLQPEVAPVSASADPDVVDFSQVACYVSCGLDWDDKDTAAIYQAKKQYGFRCIFTIYDLVPSLFPEFLPRDPGRYIRYFSEALWTADRILTISQSSRSDILRFAKDHHLPALAIDIVSPGSDLDPGVDSKVQTLASRRVLEVMQKAGRYALTVGTLEARKNHKLLVDIWLDLLQEVGGNRLPHLVLVGGRGWGFDDLFRTLESWPELATHVHILDGLSDLELRMLYENCDIFLYPSFYEGWGIPLTEAAAFGKTIISSSSSSMPEAAPPGLSQFIDPLDYPAWHEAIKDWVLERRKNSVHGPEKANIRTWKQAGEEFATHVALFLKQERLQG